MLLEFEGYTVRTVSSAEEGLSVLESEYYPLVITDVKMEGLNGIEFLKKIKEIYENQVEVILVTGYGSVETAVKTMKLGAFGYFIKSHDPEELLLEIKKVSNVINLRKKSEDNSSTKKKFLVTSKNSAMSQMWDMVAMVAATDANVLITGESGVGKEIVAKRIYELSDRKSGVYMPINCQSFPDNLIESELFGHEKGAFTGATSARVGKLEEATGGTIFIDEIGDMQIDTQIKLLRVLEERNITRIGSNNEIDVDFRLISATNKNLKEAIDVGSFRQDFLYRINTVEIKVPPLRERREDIMDLINIFVTKISADMGKKITDIDSDTKEFLLNYSYPGNVRELRNIVERLIIFSTDGILRNVVDSTSQHDFTEGDSMNSDSSSIAALTALEAVSYKEAKVSFEKEYITKVLCSCDNNITLAAKKMEMSRRQLFNKITALGINTSDN